MPLIKIDISDNQTWGLWKIEESESLLQSILHPREKVPDELTHPEKRLEWMAGRMLVDVLLKSMGLTFDGITKDMHGKPFLVNHQPRQLSLSHSYPYVAAIIHQHEDVGIDIEQPTDKLIRVAPRIFSAVELSDAGNDTTKLCVYWCAKEAMIKIYGKKDLSLAQQLKVSPFTLANQGTIHGNIIANEYCKNILLQYRIFHEFVVVYSIR